MTNDYEILSANAAACCARDSAESADDCHKTFALDMGSESIIVHDDGRVHWDTVWVWFSSLPRAQA